MHLSITFNDNTNISTFAKKLICNGEDIVSLDKESQFVFFKEDENDFELITDLYTMKFKAKAIKSFNI